MTQAAEVEEMRQLLIRAALDILTLEATVARLQYQLETSRSSRLDNRIMARMVAKGVR
jgi:hypothetical protein